jgi:hypothetical protein
LQWNIDNPNAEKVLSDYGKFGVDVPDDLTPPDLHDVEWFYWEAYMELHTDRRESGAIPGSAIRDYAGKRGTDSQLFTRIMRMMDGAYMSHKSGTSKEFSREIMRR